MMNRWAGRALPGGEKARRGSRRSALARQKAIRLHDQCAVPMQAILAPACIVAQPALALGVLVVLLHGPVAVGQLNQPTQRGGHRRVTQGPLASTAGTGCSPCR